MDLIDLAAGGTFETLLCHPSSATAVIQDRAAASSSRLLAPAADNLRGEAGDRRQGYRVHGDTALIPVIGTLIPRGPVGMAGMGFNITSYEGLREELRRATGDKAIASIVLMIDSSGGYVTGIDATSDAILVARRSKPVIAVVEGMAASAAYWIASQCDAIVAAPFATLGSIGVLQVHVEMSRALDRAGIAVTIIRAGAHKAEANPYEQLTDDVRAELQSSVDTAREAFVDAVVSGRNKAGLDAAAVLATEARLFDTKTSIALGLADSTGTLDALLDGQAELADMRRFTIVGPGFTAGRPAAVITGDHPGAPNIDRHRAALPAIAAPTVAIAVDGEGAAASSRELERARIGRILSHDFARGVGKKSAEFLAYETDQSAEVAIGILDVAASEYASNFKAREPTLAEEMAAYTLPQIGPDGGISLEQLTPAQRGAFEAARLLGKDPIEAAFGKRAISEDASTAARLNAEPGASPRSSAPHAETFRRPQ